ncbi:tRNA (guanine(46)-N(7))-methyltransferase TrmB [Planctobacterium marinum]|uniref:tRNA (guanine(46)-N(7))-methyltransferase n=1 Tax=Planctobacterium marinum TaxID=1631968 RepID=A0AA48KQS5_9ALTE|nr:hypothetical protein MACH26_02350 [Planctobacterium marinum]
MQGNSRSISTNQTDIHDKLSEIVLRHQNSVNQKPIQAHTQEAYERVSAWLKQFPEKDIILDSCCGIGESTWRLAKQYPDALVVGVDKSAVRVEKHGKQEEYQEFMQGEANTGNEVSNYCVVRADVIDFWRLVKAANWSVARHYLLYPNPYPKSAQVQKRWHATASLQDILAIGGTLTVRSNWQIYVQEFAKALELCGRNAAINQVEQGAPFTPFERKYWNSGQQSWQLVSSL